MADRAHGYPRLPSVAFIRLAGLKMIADRQNIEAGLVSYSQFQKFMDWELFVRQLKSDLLL